MPTLLDALGPYTASAHVGLWRLDRALRAVIGAADRPDPPLPGEAGEVTDCGQVPYAGTPLTEAQQQEVQPTFAGSRLETQAGHPSERTAAQGHGEPGY